MRLFRLFLAAVVLLGFGLSTLPARAAGTLTWSLPQWKNRHGTNRLTDLLNRDDCLSDATATFSMPGEYIIRIEGNDSSGVGGGGFQCCWTTAYVKVSVKAASTGGK